MSPELLTSEPTGAFDQDSERVLRSCRSAFSDLIDAMPTKIQSASSLQRALRIDMKLAWKIWKVVKGGSLGAGVYMPGRPNIGKLIVAARRRGVSAGVLEKIAAAADEFDHLVATHAGDRSTFDTMVSARGSEDLRQRRTAFRANRHVRGVQARIQLKSAIIRPSDSGDQLDLVTIQGRHDLRRVRYDGPLVVSRVRILDDDHGIRRSNWEPLGPSAAQDAGPSVLGPFCSQDLPPFRSVRAAGNFVVGELVGNGVGNRSAITYLDGYLARGAVPRYRVEGNRYGAISTQVTIPCEALVLDLVVEEGALGALNPLVGCYGGTPGELGLPENMDSCDRFPLNESAVFLGKGLPALRCSDIERHAEMYGAVFHHLGWASERFEVYRCQIAFPTMLSSVLIRFDLPPAPTAP